MKEKKDFKDIILRYILITIGAAIAAFAVEAFLAPHKIFDGGVVGVSMILSHYTFPSLGFFMVLLNIPFLIIALRSIGRRFIVRAAYSMGIFSAFTYLMANVNVPITDSFLATVFGGIILGIGVGLVLRNGACLDGTEIIGIIVSKKTSLSVGNVVLIINIIIYLVAGILFGLESGLYSMIMYFITSKVIDIVEVGMDQGKSIMIVTEDGKRIADAIHENLGRTVTFIRGEGLVSGTEKDILYCVVTRAEIYDLRKMMQEMNVEAFTTISDVSEIIGNHIKKVEN